MPKPQPVKLTSAARAAFAWLPDDPCPVGVYSHVGDGQMVRVDPDGSATEILPGGYVRHDSLTRERSDP